LLPFANFEIGTDAVVLLFADQWTHLRFALQRRAQLDALGFFRHGFHKLWIDFLLDENAAACRTNFALIDEDSEERAVNGRFPIRAIEKDIGRFASKLERDALERVRGTLDR